MSEIKKYELFVNEQIDDFYEDYEDSQKRIKLFIAKLIYKVLKC